jgi:hypothetical protein
VNDAIQTEYMIRSVIRFVFKSKSRAAGVVLLKIPEPVLAKSRFENEGETAAVFGSKTDQPRACPPFQRREELTEDEHSDPVQGVRKRPEHTLLNITT